MTLSQLRVFFAVVEQGSFRNAARSLDIAQSALTHAIQSLEAELGVSLLTRSHLGISMTPFGEKLLVRAGSILQDCDRVQQDMRQVEGEPEGKIALGVTSEPLGELLLPVLKRFIENFPHVSVNVSSGTSKTLTEKIRDGRLDFAVCALSPQVVDADLSIERLYSSVASIVARKDHPKAAANSIHTLKDCEWIGIRPEGIVGTASDRLIAMFNAEGLGLPKIALTAESTLETLYLVSETDYLTLLPRILVELKLFSSALVSIPIREAFNPRDICLIRRSGSPPTFVAQELATMLISYSRLHHSRRSN